MKRIHLIGEFVEPFQGYPDMARFEVVDDAWVLKLDPLYKSLARSGKLLRGEEVIDLELRDGILVAPKALTDNNWIVEVNLSEEAEPIRAWARF
jgi:hypothetical protein